MQVFISDTRDKIFAIDQLNKEMKESGDFNLPEDDHCRLMLAEEY